MACGFISGISGGILSDRFGKKSNMARTWICVIGNAIACPLFIAAMLLKDNFWLSLACIGARYALGETWKAPNLTIIQDTVSPKKYGRMVSAYQFFYIMSGCMSAFTIGSIVHMYNLANNGRALGWILAWSHLLAYVGAIGCFWMAGRHFVAIKEKKKFSLY